MIHPIDLLNIRSGVNIYSYTTMDADSIADKDYAVPPNVPQGGNETTATHTTTAATSLYYDNNTSNNQTNRLQTTPLPPNNGTIRMSHVLERVGKVDDRGEGKLRRIDTEGGNTTAICNLAQTFVSSSDANNCNAFTNGNNTSNNSNTIINNNNQPLTTIPPPPPPTKTTNTLFSTYDYQTKTETFPSEIKISTERRRIICACIEQVFKIKSPRDFQVFAVYCMVFLSSQVLYLIRKTGEGKSLVVLTTAAMLRGVTIVFVPLIGLGSDQVNKCIDIEKGIEAYHIDENKGDDFKLLCERLFAITPNNEGRTATSTILFCSPHSLDPSTTFSKVLMKLAQRKLITSVFIDEAHTIHRDGKHGSNFRSEFDIGVSNLMNIIDKQETNINVSIMSATLTEEYQKTVTELINKEPTVVCWGEMSRRNISLGVGIVGKPHAAIKRKLQNDYVENPQRKTLVYTNSKTIAETTLTRTSEGVLESLNVDGDVIALTGDGGVMMKTFIMAMFCESSTNNDKDKIDDSDVDMVLPNLLIVPSTASGNAGISSKGCDRCYRYSIPPNLIDICQEMGRVDRGHDAQPGQHRYYIYMSFDDVMNLFVRTYQKDSNSVRAFELKELLAVLHFTVLPQRCLHVHLEDMFEKPCTNVERQPCGNMCTFCNSGHVEFTKQFSRQGLVSVLLSNIFDKGSVSISVFKKGLNEHVTDIYGSDNASTKSISAGNIHALGLQLVASGLVEVVVEDKLIGKESLKKSDIRLKLGKENDKLLILDESNWRKHQFNCT